MVVVAPTVTWLVREALAFDGYSRSREWLSRRLGEPVFEIETALSELLRRGEVRQNGALWISSESPALNGGVL